MKTTKTKKPKAWVNIRIDKVVYLTLKKTAKKNGQSLSEVIKNAVALYVFETSKSPL